MEIDICPYDFVIIVEGVFCCVFCSYNRQIVQVFFDRSEGLYCTSFNCNSVKSGFSDLTIVKSLVIKTKLSLDSKIIYREGRVPSEKRRYVDIFF